MAVVRVLCPTDFSESSEKAITYAKELAVAIGATRLELVHVDDIPTYGIPDGSILDEPRRAAWQAKLDAARTAHAGAIEVDAATVRGKPHEEIVRYAKDADADLIVMGTRGKALPRLLLGSTTDRVLRSAGIPVIAVPPDGRPARTPKRILVALDFSPISERALEMAVELGLRLGAELDAVHVYRTPVTLAPEGLGLPGVVDLVAEIEAAARESMAALEARFTGRRAFTAHVIQGDPKARVEELAEQLGTDLVVVGTHGRSGVQRWVLGSVAERIVRGSHVPVMVVPP